MCSAIFFSVVAATAANTKAICQIHPRRASCDGVCLGRTRLALLFTLPRVLSHAVRGQRLKQLVAVVLYRENVSRAEQVGEGLGLNGLHREVIELQAQAISQKHPLK